MSRTGLGRYGVVPRTVLRAPTRDADGVRICPECGDPIETTKGTQMVSTTLLVDAGLAAGLDEQVPTHGWACERHSYPLVTPTRADLPGWVPVEARYGDGEIRAIPVPQKEVR